MRRRARRQVGHERIGEALRPRRTACSGTTSRTRSRPTMPGLVRALWTSEASSRSVVDSTPVMAPRTRSRRTRARVSMPSMPRTSLLAQVVVEGALRAEVAGHARQLADDEALDLRPARLAVVGVDAVVADQRIGHGDDLALVGRIGEHFLIAGHAGVEDDLAGGLAGGAEAAAGVDRAVFQGQFRRERRHRGSSTK